MNDSPIKLTTQDGPTGAEAALLRTRFERELAEVNGFLAAHKNQRTGVFDAPFTVEEWLGMSEVSRQNNLAVVRQLTQPKLVSAAVPTRREADNHNTFWSNKEEEQRQQRIREGRE